MLRLQPNGEIGHGDVWLGLHRLEHVPEKCGRFSDKDRLEIKGLEHFR